MNIHTLHPAAGFVFNVLPAEFREAFIFHKYKDDPDEFLSELAIAWLEGRTPAQARASARRFNDGGQAPRLMSSLNELIENIGEHGSLGDDGVESCEDCEKWAEIEGIPTSTSAIAKQRGITRRRAQQILKEQVARARICGDMWVNQASEASLHSTGKGLA